VSAIRGEEQLLNFNILGGNGMTNKEFFNKLQEAIETDVTIDENTNLKSLPEYSSLTTLLIIAFIDENFGKSLTAKELNSVNSVKSLMDLIGDNQFE
jgi:acyl carrier protein